MYRPLSVAKVLMQPSSLPHNGITPAYKPISLMNMESLCRAITHVSRREKETKKKPILFRFELSALEMLMPLA